MLAYPFKGNAFVYNNILKTIDLNVQIPPPVGKGQMVDLVCKIFSDPKYVNEKNKISNLILSVNKSNGTTILKMINLVKMFRPANEAMVTPMYTPLSKTIENAPPGYLDGLLSHVTNIQDKIKDIENKISISGLLNMIKGLISKKGGKKRKMTKKSKKIRKNKKQSKQSKKTRKHRK